MKPELALLHTNKLRHVFAAQDAVNFPFNYWGGAGVDGLANYAPGAGLTPSQVPLPTGPPPTLTGYTPSSIMQGYVDFYNNNPTASGATAPPWNDMSPPGTDVPWLDPSDTSLPSGGNYPAPGTGAPPAPSQSIISRIFHNIPAVRLATALGRLIPHQSWQNNAAPRVGPMQGPPAVPPGGALFGFNPAQGGGTPQFDFTTGTYRTNPSNNPLYSTGGPWQPVANAPVDIRFDQNSGTGNYTADRTTNNFLASGGYRGNPNRAVAPDAGRNSFSPQSGFSGTVNQDTGLLERQASTPLIPFQGSTQGAPPLRAGDPASAEAYNTWLMNQPGYQSWATQPNAASNTQALQPFGWMNVPQATVSGPPIPRGLFGIG